MTADFEKKKLSKHKSRAMSVWTSRVYVMWFQVDGKSFDKDDGRDILLSHTIASDFKGF